MPSRAFLPWQIFDILGYERPADAELLSSFPEDILSVIMDALRDARSELGSKGIITGGKEASEAFAKHGLSTSMEGKNGWTLEFMQTPNFAYLY